MSTTFKIIENHIENSRISPKKSSVLTASQHLSPFSKRNQSIDGSDDIEQDEVLKMEIKQLQRENKFLKKKISELVSQAYGQSSPRKKTIRTQGKGAIKQEIDPTLLTVQYFFKQINNLMNSMADVFKVEFTNQQVQEYSTRFPSNSQSIPADKKYCAFKKFTLSRKLQKVTLQSEQKRYPLLLDIFSTFYKAKQQCDKFIRQHIDQLTTRALQLNKMLYNGAIKKKNSMRGSSIKSTYTAEEGQSHTKNVNVVSQFGLGAWTIRKFGPQTSPLAYSDIKKNGNRAY